MGQAPSGQGGGPPPERDPEKEKAERERRKKAYAPRPPLHTGRRRRRNRGTGTSGKLPKVYPTSKCKLRLLKLERIKDYLLMEQEFIRNQEVFKPHEEKDKEERDKMEDIRGSPLAVGSLEEMIDDTRVVGVLDIHILEVGKKNNGHSQKGSQCQDDCSRSQGPLDCTPVQRTQFT